MSWGWFWLFGMSLLGTGAFVQQVPGEAVAIDVAVSWRARPVSGLTAANFELTDNGVPQPIEVERPPVGVVLVVDVSRTVTGSKRKALEDGARAFLKSLDEKDEVALVTYDALLRLENDWTPAPGGLGAIFPWRMGAAGRFLNEALYAGLKLADSSSKRPVVVVFADGADTGSHLEEEDLLDAARASRAVVYAIGVPPSVEGFEFVSKLQSSDVARGRPRQGQPSAAEVFRRRDLFLERLARTSGGRLQIAPDEAHIEAEFVRVAEDARSRYLVKYVPHGVPTSGWHFVKIRLKDAVGELRYRREYYRPSSEEGSPVSQHF